MSAAYRSRNTIVPAPAALRVLGDGGHQQVQRALPVRVAVQVEVVALGQQRAHRERRRRQVVRVLGAPRLDQLGDLGGGEHVVLPQRGREERRQHGLAGAVAHDVVVEVPLVLGPLARPPNARSRNCRPSTVNVPRSPSSESHSAAFERRGGAVVLERQRRAVLARRSSRGGAWRPRRRAPAPPGRAWRATRRAPRTSSSVWCSVSVMRTPACFIGTAGNVPRFV